jgi:hypothetical protein
LEIRHKLQLPTYLFRIFFVFSWLESRAGFICFGA